MANDLGELLREIGPEQTIEETLNRVSEALNRFPMKRAEIADWESFRGCMVEFVRHVESWALCLRRPVPASFDFCWGRAVGILNRIYGPNGEKAAFEMARTGCEGGLYAVLKAVATQIAEDVSRNEISARVGVFWNSHSAEELLEASSEYLAKYGHLVPPELTEVSAGRFRGNFRKVLEDHPKLVQRMRQVGR